jgi:hypothetical protein
VAPLTTLKVTGKSKVRAFLMCPGGLAKYDSRLKTPIGIPYIFAPPSKIILNTSKLNLNRVHFFVDTN